MTMFICETISGKLYLPAQWSWMNMFICEHYQVSYTYQLNGHGWTCSSVKHYQVSNSYQHSGHSQVGGLRQKGEGVNELFCPIFPQLHKIQGAGEVASNCIRCMRNAVYFSDLKCEAKWEINLGCVHKRPLILAELFVHRIFDFWDFSWNCWG